MTSFGLAIRGVAWGCAALLATTAAWPVRAAAGPVVTASLADLSLEQLSEVVVTTVSRVAERLDHAAASVYVISADDIRRSGARTIPEALRLAPNLDVARADANQYAISARGFNNVFANKMLVLIDGRTVYTPLFSGVFWEVQDAMLEDVDRIEVVSGPSTALWGSNAVNGLIHVITRTAAATQGGAVSLHAGNRESGAAARYGFALGDAAHFRLYAKSYDRRSSHRGDGSAVNDSADGLQTGFRADWSRSRDVITLQGDAYRGTIDQAPASGRTFAGGNVVARWQRSFEGGAESSVQLYADHTERNQPGRFSERLDTFDGVAQYSFKPLDGHVAVVGGGYRQARDRTGGSPGLAFMPASRTLGWSRVFAQDQIDLGHAIVLTLSASLEGNPYSSPQTLPGARLAWTPGEGRLLWASYAKAVRAPSRIDRELFIPGQPPYVLAGGPDFESEVSDVFELGYRAQASQTLSYSVTLFDARHRRLRSLAPRAQGPQFENGIGGSTRGLESWARWRVSDHWRLDAGLVLQSQRLEVQPGAVDVGGMAALGNDPHGYASLRSSLDVARGWSWDLDARRVGARPNPAVPAYTAVDTRLAWRVRGDVDLAVGVQNLLDRRHPEWGVASNRVELERNVFVQLRLRN